MPTLPVERARKRGWYLLAVVVVIALGLASRRFPSLSPSILGKYPGDALWTLMVFLSWAIVCPRASTLRVFICALATSYLVELFKLYRADWINAVRNSTTGHLVLGSAFSMTNLVAYTIGAALGALGETTWPKLRSPNHPADGMPRPQFPPRGGP